MLNSNRDLKKEKYWRETIEKYRGSGKSQAQFCRDEGLNAHKFYYWNSVLAKRQKVRNQAKPLLEDKMPLPFVALKVPDIDSGNKPVGAEQIEISKIVLRISAYTDKSTLACILQSLEKA